jgi:hypothetical protein
MSEANTQVNVASQPNVVPNPPSKNLVTMNVDNQNVAFNIIIGFVSLAQRRGAFSLDEASKIFECVKMFNREDGNSA